MNVVTLLLMLCVAQDWFGLDAQRLNDRLRKINDLAQHQKAEEALKEANQAVVDYPGNSLLYLNRGCLLYRTDDKDAALRDFERAAQSDQPEIRYRALFNKARALYDKGHKIVQEAHLPDTVADLPKEQDVSTLVKAAEQALSELGAAEEGFVQTLLARADDRDAKESLEAVSTEAARVRSLLEELKQRQKQQDQQNQQNKKDKDKKDQEQKQDQQQPDATQKQDQNQQQNDDQSSQDQSKDSSQSKDKPQDQEKNKDPQQSQKDKEQQQHKPDQDQQKPQNNAK